MGKCKKCNKCNQIKPLDEFYNNKRIPGGKANRCRECMQKNVRSARMPMPGLIYIMSNPAWPEYFKVGRTGVGVENRIMSYQTCSPFRDYEIVFSKHVNDTSEAERLISEQFNGNAEWYNEKLSDLIAFIESL